MITQRYTVQVIVNNSETISQHYFDTFTGATEFIAKLLETQAGVVNSVNRLSFNIMPPNPILVETI